MTHQHAVPTLHVTASCHHPATGDLMIPSTTPTALLRSIADAWTTCPCPDITLHQAAAPFAATLLAYADRIDLAFIETTTDTATRQPVPVRRPRRWFRR
ncbi:hypothetical protein ACIA8O_38950 [Kitasatospora sp. NPDC051853]|uniref:hypothetical protein n=1 Tax=Kitasatospora sp. NPDC051853 TaxID=3364058 RepID=UPI0037B07D86